MKIVFTIPKAQIDNAAITMENQNLSLKALFGIANNISYAYDNILLATATNVIISVSIDKTVQGAGYLAAGVVTGAITAAVTFTVLENDGNEVWDNFQVVTLTKIQKGITHLIPVGSTGAVPMVPGVLAVPIGNVPSLQIDPAAAAQSSTIAATAYRYDAPMDMDILNATNIPNVICVTLQGGVLHNKEVKREISKQSESISFGVATGQPRAIQAAQDLGISTF